MRDVPRAERRLLSIGYAIGALLILVPLTEWTLTIWPLRFDQVIWRWAAFSVLSQALSLPVVGLAVLALTALKLDHRRLLKAFSGGYVVLAVAILALLGLAALDGLQMQGAAQNQTRQNVTVTLVRVAATYAVYVGILGWLAAGAWSASARGGAGAGSGAAGRGLINSRGDAKAEKDGG